MSDGLSFRSCFFRACEKNNMEMVEVLINNDYELDLQESKRQNEGEKSPFPLLRRQFTSDSRDSNLLKSFRVFRATTRPAYLLARFLNKYDLGKT